MSKTIKMVVLTGNFHQKKKSKIMTHTSIKQYVKDFII